MSRTDQHAPARIRIARGELSAQALHDHSHIGGCDLPDRRDHRTRGTRCAWYFVYSGIGECGCSMCTRRHERRAANRADRRASRRELARGEL